MQFISFVDLSEPNLIVELFAKVLEHLILCYCCRGCKTLIYWHLHSCSRSRIHWLQVRVHKFNSLRVSGLLISLTLLQVIVLIVNYFYLLPATQLFVYIKRITIILSVIDVDHLERIRWLLLMSGAVVGLQKNILHKWWRRRLRNLEVLIFLILRRTYY